MNKKLATLGVTLGLAAGGAAGFAFGQPSISGAVASTWAATVTTDTTAADTDHAAEHVARLTEVLQPLVDDGTLTQAQLDAVVAKLGEAAPMGGGRHGGGFGDGGKQLETVATALGITTDELRTSLQDGSSIADIAATKGVEVQTVIDSMVAAATEQVNAKVTDGTITQAEADERLAALTTRITSMVNGDLPMGGRGMGGPGMGGPGMGGPGMGGHGGMHGDDGDADDAAATTTTGN